MAVGAQQNLDLGPMDADRADEAADKGANLHPARPLTRPQHRDDKAAFAVKDDNRLEVVIVTVAPTLTVGTVVPIDASHT
jgi:hypothetical protein